MAHTSQNAASSWDPMDLRHTLITAVEADIRSTEKKYSKISIVTVQDDGTTIAMDSSTGLGFKGAGILLGTLIPKGPHEYKWTWGWKIPGYGSPLADKDTISRYMADTFPTFKLAINAGSAILRSRETERFMRAVCVRAYGLKTIVEMRGPTNHVFVIGLTTIDHYKYDGPNKSDLQNMARLVERGETDPIILANAGMAYMKIKENGQAIDASKVEEIINNLKDK